MPDSGTIGIWVGSVATVALAIPAIKAMFFNGVKSQVDEANKTQSKEIESAITNALVPITEDIAGVRKELKEHAANDEVAQAKIFEWLNRISPNGDSDHS